MKPLKLALIRQRYTDFGGAERFVANAVASLRQQGAHLTLITRQWKRTGGDQPLICNPFYLGSVWRDWGFARCVCDTLKNHPFDLVQSHERITCCDIYRAGDGVHREWLAQRRRSMGLPGKLGLSLNPYHHYVLAAEKRLFLSPTLKAVICNSNMVKDEILHHFNIAADKLHIIYSGVDIDTFHPGLKVQHRTDLRQRYAIPEDATLFLFVGSGYERKGLNALLKAMARLPAQSHLLVVGKDKAAARYQQMAIQLGINTRIHFAGSQQDVRPFYGAADAFVLPTLYDPFPNAALEAFACGLPVVTSTKSGAAEFIRNGKNGFVCDALDVAGLTSALNRLADPAYAASLAPKARETVIELTPAQMSGRLLALYEMLLGLSATE